MATFNAGSIEATLDLDVDPFQRGIRIAREEGRAFARERFVATAELNMRGQQQALATLVALQAGLDRYGATRATAHVGVTGGAAAFAEVEALEAQLGRFDHQRFTATADVDTRGFEAGISGSLGGMQALIAAGALLGPALIPGLAGAAAAAGALTAALLGAGGAAAALGAGVIGNIKNVLGAQDTLTQSTAAVAAAGQQVVSAQQAQAAAAHQVDQAEQGLANARQARAQAIAAAQQQVQQATLAVTDAQEGLNQAVEDARDQLKAYQDQLKGAALDQEGAELAVRAARQRLAEVLADPIHTQLAADEAQHALDAALFQLDQVKQDRDSLRDDAKEARDEGVMGSDQVTAAQDRLRDAKRQLAAAEQALADARRQGAQQVAAAQYALEQAQQAQGNAATSAAAAATALQKAQDDQAAALETTSTPAAQAFLGAIDDLKSSWQDFLAATEPASLGLATQALGILEGSIGRLAPVTNAAADAASGLLDRFGSWLDGPGGDKMFGFLQEWGPVFITDLGEIAGSIGRLFGNLAVAFAPFADEMLNGLNDIIGGWADAAAGFEDNPQFQDFLDYVRENGPLFLDVLGDIGGFFVDIGEALAPAARPVLLALHSVFQAISDMDPTTRAVLIGVAGAIAAITIAPVAGTAVAAVAFGAALASIADEGGPAGEVLQTLADLFGPVRDVIADMVDNYLDKFSDQWDDMHPTLQNLADVLADDLKPAWDDFWETFGPAMVWLAGAQGTQAGLALRVLVWYLTQLAETLAATMNILSGTFSGDWDRVWKGIGQTPQARLANLPLDFAGMLGGLVTQVRETPLGQWWSTTWDRMQDRAGAFKELLLLTLIKGEDSLLGRLKVGFHTGMDAIGSTFDLLRKAAGTPVKFVVDYVWNDGLRVVLNAIPGVDNMDKIDTSGWPSFARGGVLPGYSPGRDIHRFYSPTGGVLNLGGGEGILTTRAVDQLGGPDGIMALNERAERGQLAGLIKILRGSSHATGGVVTIDGEPMSRLAAAQLAVAEAASKVNMTVIQGSYQAPSTYSGTSHTGGGVMDTVPGTFGMQDWLRRLAFAAWARNIPGAAYAGEGAHVHSVSLIDPAAAGNVQAAAYRAGGDGLGGSDYGPRPNPDPGLVQQALDLAGADIRPGLLQVGGGNPFAQFMAAIHAAESFAERVPGLLKKLDAIDSPWTDMIMGAAKYVGNKTVGYVNEKIPGPGPFPANVFDAGGWMGPGWAVNASQRPEAVLTEPQWRALSALAAEGGHGVAQGMSRGDVERLIDAIRESRSVYAAVSSRAELEAALKALEDELRRG